MNCDEIRPMLAGYVDDQLPALQRKSVEQHLADCGRCREVLQGQQSVQRILAQYEQEPIGPEIWQQLAARMAKTPALSKQGEKAIEEAAAIQPPVAERKAPAARLATPTPSRVSSQHLRHRWVAHVIGLAVAIGLLLLYVCKVLQKMSQ